ncbi:hypothetical protein I307_05139 [Cryptococcus deuterogattii 99/473]|uniref:Uncharacterized protein n=1 Tax=Cryptococcus deuterogattii Ram5 TaxID=1296110 RepID=A0A0D0TAA1_9TREE|nr:hypothetical protein I309_03763 [Cryptococcus deuterogattii LA55]KIR36070.1 hypothetical protein I352_01014 [Cryptococcus deuterogattii MMRL2647]KIR42972.1 hypothetical protein I313_01179 [Cryptococcus deuterogattii Ram5]KIR75503.1 hypothetical protein I310_00196 [Cryptococcus deuterogattii CA1014]KIR95443.1 hypothetical protein I304_00194 [Cryptococcus deuterogattii CBS 10090]KIS01939.1 hypothetical protein L804_00195 [Cryptococcus deuterogattii 2001/935-1]KIY55548.1 hypothetical protein 
MPHSTCFLLRNNYSPAITIGPFKPSRPGYGPVLSYLQAAQLPTPLRIHPLLQLRTWDPKPYAKFLTWNTIEHPMFAAIWVDYDDTETVCSFFHNAITLTTDTSLLVIYEVRNGITCEDVLFAIYDFFASPLYVDELGEMHPRAVRIISKSAGWVSLSYRKSDALLGATYFDGQ